MCRCPRLKALDHGVVVDHRHPGIANTHRRLGPVAEPVVPLARSLCQRDDLRQAREVDAGLVGVGGRPLADAAERRQPLAQLATPDILRRLRSQPRNPVSRPHKPHPAHHNPSSPPLLPDHPPGTRETIGPPFPLPTHSATMPVMTPRPIQPKPSPPRYPARSTPIPSLTPPSLSTHNPLPSSSIRVSPLPSRTPWTPRLPTYAPALPNALSSPGLKLQSPASLSAPPFFIKSPVHPCLPPIFPY